MDNISKAFAESGMLVETEPEKVETSGEKVIHNIARSLATDKQYRELAVANSIIPKDFQDAVFDIEKIKNNILAQIKAGGVRFNVRGIKDYEQVCNRIIFQIKSGIIPNRSYLIGAPNGFGKQSFVTECLVECFKNNWTTVPYISLNELAIIAAAEEEASLRGLMSTNSRIGSQEYSYREDKFKDKRVLGVDDLDMYDFDTIRKVYTKMPNTIIGNFSWSEYINAPVLFVFFSAINNRKMEAHTLKSLLMIRSAKGYPTIALTSDSIDPFEKDPVVGKFWRDIVLRCRDVKPDTGQYNDYFEMNDKGTALHVSCYKWVEDKV